jgi:hypothetical protein
MPPVTSNFSALICKKGYRWEPLEGAAIKTSSYWHPAGRNTPRLSLVPIVYFGRAPNEWRSSPRTCDQSGLFRNFAYLEPTPDEVIEFANEHGELFDAQETFAEWEFEVRTMRFLLEVWDAVSAGGRSATIKTNFVPSKRPGEIDFPFAKDVLGYSPLGRHGDVGHGLSISGSPLQVARYYVIEAINVRLEALGTRLMVGLSEPHNLTTSPKSLLCALWTQFAIALSENKSFRECEVCGTAFELDPDINRTSRYYCDNACRVKAYRQRKEKAKQLHKRGLTIQQIAEELESKSVTVKKWLKQGG